ncbi:GNAT family N-acetyltransferase [Sphingobacterium lactis]|uniref:GNAT family N-acetyltransferase n=1 Tax=Sphingobacterium lactis TaxID=797291 RepID=UPI003F823519
MSNSMTVNDLVFRPAVMSEAEAIWGIIQQAIQKRKEEGSDQWQNGYPNLKVIQEDIEAGYAYVHVDENNHVYGYLALIFDVEPAYEDIDGKWLTDWPYAVVHRIAVNQEPYVKGQASSMMEKIEPICLENGYQTIKVDTNFDNVGMLRVFEKLGYTYCGEVNLRGGMRKAYEKVLK